MAFRITKKETSNFSNPQEMYKDYKNRMIQGPLDYQSAMINLYMDNKCYEKKMLHLNFLLAVERHLLDY